MIFSHFSGKAIKECLRKNPGGSMIDLSSDSLEACPSPAVLEAMERALRSPESFGTPPALLEKLGPHSLPVSGVNNALWLALQAWLNPNDEAVVFAPCPPAYTALINLLGAVPKIVKLDEEEAFSPDIDLIKAQISPRTRLILFSNPQQPTGVLWDKESLCALVKLAKEKNLLLLSDETSSSFIYEGGFTSLAECSHAFENIAVIKGLAPSLPGWHMASLSSCHEFLGRARGLFEISGANLNSTALFVLNEAWEHLNTDRTLEELKERRDTLVKALDRQHGFRVTRPLAGTSCFPYMRYYLGNEIGGEVPTTASMFAEIVARKAGVLIASGTDYGMDGFFKCSFTLPPDTLAEALRRIGGILEQGKPAPRL